MKRLIVWILLAGMLGLCACAPQTPGAGEVPPGAESASSPEAEPASGAEPVSQPHIPTLTSREHTLLLHTFLHMPWVVELPYEEWAAVSLSAEFWADGKPVKHHFYNYDFNDIYTISRDGGPEVEENRGLADSKLVLGLVLEKDRMELRYWVLCRESIVKTGRWANPLEQKTSGGQGLAEGMTEGSLREDGGYLVYQYIWDAQSEGEDLEAGIESAVYGLRVYLEPTVAPAAG